MAFLRMYLRPVQARREEGFTLLETLTVLVMVGILAAIAAPSWQVFWINQQLTTARDELRQGIQQAQAASVQQKVSWRFSLREQNNRIQWTVHPSALDWQQVSAWQTLNENITLASADTTLASSGGVRYVRFDYRGDVAYRLSTVTLASKTGLGRNRCVIVSTLIGAMRNGEGRTYPNGNDRLCY